MGAKAPFFMADRKVMMTTNNDDTIKVCLDSKCMNVSSMHLTADAEARLRRIHSGEIPNLKAWEDAQ